MRRISITLVCLLFSFYIVASDQSSILHNVSTWLWNYPKTTAVVGTIASAYGISGCLMAKDCWDHRYAVSQLQYELAKECPDKQRVGHLLTKLWFSTDANEVSDILAMCHREASSVTVLAYAACDYLEHITSDALVGILHALPSHEQRVEIAQAWGEELHKRSLFMSLEDEVIWHILELYPQAVAYVLEQVRLHKNKLDADIYFFERALETVTFEHFGPNLECLAHVVDAYPACACEIAQIIAPYIDRLSEGHKCLMRKLLLHDNEMQQIAQTLLPYMQTHIHRINWEIAEAYTRRAGKETVARLAPYICERNVQIHEFVLLAMIQRCPEYVVPLVEAVCSTTTWRDYVWQHGTIRAFLMTDVCDYCLEVDAESAHILVPYAQQHIYELPSRVARQLAHHNADFASRANTCIPDKLCW